MVAISELVAISDPLSETPRLAKNEENHNKTKFLCVSVVFRFSSNYTDRQISSEAAH
jgi:hypothetical protein